LASGCGLAALRLCVYFILKLKLRNLIAAAPAFFVATSVLAAEEFIAGTDFSHLTFFEDRGVVYKDDGQARDGLQLLKEHGLNCVRLRLFTSSAAQAQADPYNAINNLEYNLPLAVRVKNAGLKFLLDFHYSDTWADPGKQTKPSAWTNLTFVQLEQEMRAYNSNCIAAFRVAGAMPDFIQIGNEITPGMLWPDGRVTGNNNTSWSNLGRLLKAAIAGINDAKGTNQPKIMIHIDRGGDWNTTKWYFDNIQNQQIPFDIIGQSYYPWWHGDFDALRNCLTNTANRYGKPVVVVETAFPWGGTSNVFGIPATTNGQVQFVRELASIVKGLPGGKGVGIFWWAGEYQRLPGYNLAGFDKRSFFGSGSGSPVPAGEVLPVAAAFGQLAAPIVMQASLSGDSVALNWPLSGAGMTLKTSTSLTSFATWLPVTNTIQSTGPAFTVTLPLDNVQTRFYRLHAQ